MDWQLSVGVAIGILLSIKAFSFLRLLCSLFLIPGIPLSTFGSDDSWAVITGASDGLGKEFAYQIASRGFNVILISRTKTKLDTLAAEIRKEYSVKTKVFPFDFSRCSDDDYERLEIELRDLDVALLINNVGQSHEMPVPFTETPLEELENIIRINCLATLRVTRLVAPAMITRQRGLILTMASFGGMLPTPLLATYSGSKAFLQQWSSALGSELAPKGVRVQLVQSYLVTTAMSKIRRTSLLVPSAKAFVKAALGSIGRSGSAQGISFTAVPYWSHAFMHWMLTNFVGTMNKPLLSFNRRMHESIRTKALRKVAKDVKKGV